MLIKKAGACTGSLRAQELCESRGGRPGLPSLINLRFLWTQSSIRTIGSSWNNRHIRLSTRQTICTLGYRHIGVSIYGQMRLVVVVVFFFCVCVCDFVCLFFVVVVCFVFVLFMLIYIKIYIKMFTMIFYI